MKQKSNKVLKFINNLKIFLIVYLLFIAFVAFMIVSFGKIDIHLFINKNLTSTFADFFFKYATYLGDGVFAALILIALFIKDKKFALEFGVSWLIVIIIVQLFKRWLFADIDRPGAVIGLENLHLVEGVKLNLHHSFPSGHTATAFVVFSFFATKIKNIVWQLFFLILAIIVAFSRVYLSQHFVTDVLIGSIIGIFFTLLTVYLFEKNT